MSVEIVDYRHPDEFPADLEALFAAVERESTALGCRWYRNFLATVAESGASARFYVLRRDSRPLVAWPVLVKRSSIPLHVHLEALGNYYTALYAPAIDPEADAADVAAVIRAARRENRWLSSVRLQPMDPDSRAYALLIDGLRRDGLLPFTFHCFGNLFLRAPSSWSEFLASRHGKIRSNIKRMEKRLAEAGGHVEIITDVVDSARAIEAYERVYAESWKKPEPHPGFMPGLIAHAAEGGWLRLGIAWLGDRPIAAQVWLVSYGRAEIYKVAYDAAFKDYSPGTVLTARLMQHVIDRDRVREVDYLIGEDPYKLSWMSHRRERWGVVAYNPRTLEGALGGLQEAAWRLAKKALPRSTSGGRGAAPNLQASVARNRQPARTYPPTELQALCGAAERSPDEWNG